jgi:hypothetical protein
MPEQVNKPIFVVGSPRSGTSILTWCLGQHPNILTLEESNWMGDLAIDLAVRYQIGTAHGDRSLLSSMGAEQEEFLSLFGNAINDLILHHRDDLDRKRWERAAPPNALPEWFFLWRALEHRWESQMAGNPKTRWVDGTPEYSFHVCGLRKLFPSALFIHIVRDVTSVVRSMLNFHPIAGVSLVANQEEAYEYWFRAVSSCLLAEQAYGPGVVFRLRYSDLVDQPETSLRSLFSFLGEPFPTECLNPLRKRINTSNVPADFKLGSPQTDPAVVERAIQLYAEIETAPQPSKASTGAANKIEAAFNDRVQYVATLGREYAKAQQDIVALQIDREQMREGYEAEVRRLNADREQMREGYEAEVRRLNADREQMREGYEAEVRRLNADREQMRERYEAKHK